MLGAIIGDIVGSRFEFNNHRSKDFEMFTPGCRVTDDSIMTLAVAQAIMATAEMVRSKATGCDLVPDAKYLQLLSAMSVKYMQEIGRHYPDCGYGGMFASWLFSDQPAPYNSFGNGAAMRISPVGFIARSDLEVISLAKTITAVTHNHPEGLKGAAAAALAIYMARQGCLKYEIRHKIISDYYPLDFTIDGIRSEYQFKETCQATVPQALQCFFEAESFEDTIRTAVSLGGDSDTIAAIAGATAEAYYGIPAEMRKRALTYLDADLRAIFDEWERFIGKDN